MCVILSDRVKLIILIPELLKEKMSDCLFASDQFCGLCANTPPSPFSCKGTKRTIRKLKTSKNAGKQGAEAVFQCCEENEQEQKKTERL